MGDGSTESRVAVKVLVHGESLGGMAASYVAMKGRRTSVDFAFIDRSFASLDGVAFWGAGASLMCSSIQKSDHQKLSCCCLSREKFSRCSGKLISRLFRLVTLWKDNNW